MFMWVKVAVVVVVRWRVGWVSGGLGSSLACVGTVTAMLIYDTNNECIGYVWQSDECIGYVWQSEWDIYLICGSMSGIDMTHVHET